LPKLAALNFASKAREGIDANAHEQSVADCIFPAATSSEGTKTSPKGRERAFGKQRTDACGRRASGGCTRGGREEESTKTTEERSKELDHVANL
jgi:hypothetical protein